MILDLAINKKEILYHYSQYSFLSNLDKNKIFQHCILNKLLDLKDDKDSQFIEIEILGKTHIFVVKYLSWDSNYFNVKTYKLLYVLYDHVNYDILKSAVSKFIKILFEKKNIYCFSEIPSEDIFTIQALNENGFKLVETRLTYYLDLNQHNFERFKVRSATIDDTLNLKKVASKMRNLYDRFHAEVKFDLKKSDEFLATYIEESILGFADFVMVPNEPNTRADAFLTANYLENEWQFIGEKISKMVLSAVSSDTCKGWYIKLISEMAYHLNYIGANYAFMHPATTNKAVIHTYEKLGCKYGKSVHVLTFFS
jgi:dTDP-4-amino-4,6-dideoxy-D-galactose acyltransferase